MSAFNLQKISKRFFISLVFTIRECKKKQEGKMIKAIRKYVYVPGTIIFILIINNLIVRIYKEYL